MKCISLILALFFCGCGSVTEKLFRADRHNRESTKVYVTGTVDALGMVDEPTPEVSLASKLAKNAQSIEGLPLPEERLDVSEILANNARELRKLDDRISEDAKIALVRRDAEEKLIQLGMEKEQEDRKNIVKRIFRWAMATFGIGGLIALSVIFPFLIPVFGAILRGIFSLIPSLMNFFGLVGKGLFENVMKGVESTRHELQKDSKKTYTAEEVLKLLDMELKVSTDQKDKEFIDIFKRKLKI